MFFSVDFWYSLLKVWKLHTKKHVCVCCHFDQVWHHNGCQHTWQKCNYICGKLFSTLHFYLSFFALHLSSRGAPQMSSSPKQKGLPSHIGKTTMRNPKWKYSCIFRLTGALAWSSFQLCFLLRRNSGICRQELRVTGALTAVRFCPLLQSMHCFFHIGF